MVSRMDPVTRRHLHMCCLVILCAASMLAGIRSDETVDNPAMLLVLATIVASFIGAMWFAA